MECPECGSTCGWISEKDEGIYVDEEGEVNIGDNARWGQQVRMKCNNPNCDAIVNMYLDSGLEASRFGEVESTGAKELKDRFEKTPVKRQCSSCGKEMVTTLWPDISREGGFVLRGGKECKECNRWAEMMSSKIVEIEPTDLQHNPKFDSL